MPFAFTICIDIVHGYVYATTKIHVDKVTGRSVKVEQRPSVFTRRFRCHPEVTMFLTFMNMKAPDMILMFKFRKQRRKPSLITVWNVQCF
jgi:hypothetical protein